MVLKKSDQRVSFSPVTLQLIVVALNRDSEGVARIWKFDVGDKRPFGAMAFVGSSPEQNSHIAAIELLL